jgi:MFS family permease
MAWLKRHRLMRTLAALLGVNTFCGQMANAILVLLATQVVHVGVQGYGLLLASAAVGSVLGGMVNARIVQRIGSLPALVTGLATNIVAFVGIGFSPDPITLGGFLAVNGFVTTMWNIVTTTLRQQLVPSSVLGRVTSVYKILGWGLIPLGTLTGGLVAHGLGMRAPYELAGAVRAIALVAALPVLVAAMRAATVDADQAGLDPQGAVRVVEHPDRDPHRVDHLLRDVVLGFERCRVQPLPLLRCAVPTEDHFLAGQSG